MIKLLYQQARYKLIKLLELKQILDSFGYSLGYISIRILREYSDTHFYRFSALILTFL